MWPNLERSYSEYSESMRPSVRQHPIPQSPFNYSSDRKVSARTAVKLLSNLADLRQAKSTASSHSQLVYLSRTANATNTFLHPGFCLRLRVSR